MIYLDTHLLLYSFTTLGEKITISAASVIKINAIKIDVDEQVGDVLRDTNLTAAVEITSNFPDSLDCDEIYVTLRKLETPVQKKLSVDKKSDDSQKSNQEKTLPDDYVLIREQLHHKQDGSLSSVTLVCPNTHQILGYSYAILVYHRKIIHLFFYAGARSATEFSHTKM